MVKKINRSYSRSNSINTLNSCEQAIKGLKSEINKEGIQKKYRASLRHVVPSKQRFELKRSIIRKRILANKRNRNKQ